jgi:membrane-bound metal-dependent hydrolase YbcI (DUF457 family)
MNPITHFLASWTLADNGIGDARDRSLVTWAGVLPDLDGLGAVIDIGRGLIGQTSSSYGDYHHRLLHGLPGAIAIPAVLSIWGTRRRRVFAFGFLAVHLHLLCDLVGSRGPDPGDIWPLWYLAPLSDWPVLLWSRQWPLNAWPNILFTLLLVTYALWAAVTKGHSPVGVFSRSADVSVAATLRSRWQRMRRSPPR